MDNILLYFIIISVIFYRCNAQCVTSFGGNVDHSNLKNIYKNGQSVRVKCLNSTFIPFPTDECKCELETWDCGFVTCINPGNCNFKKM